MDNMKPLEKAKALKQVPPSNSPELVELAQDIFTRFTAIAEVVERFENEEFFNSLQAIEQVAKIVRGEAV
jgi:hypothetical protein